ncbi:transposase [Patescibacteria group bacterium]|nr:transposase [Patescibacteria group bacterium]
MSFTRIEKRGKKEYAYEITSYWDKKAKRPKQKRKYLGMVIDKKKKLYGRKLMPCHSEKLILDFGDSFSINQLIEKYGFKDLIEKSFQDLSEFVQAFITYRLCYPSAMKYSQSWFEGSYARIIHKDIKFNSQRISDFFRNIGDEYLQRKFFEEYIKDFTNSKKGIIIDATSLPNQIHMPLTAWGRNGEDIDKQIRFLLVVDKDNEMPLFFRYYSGNLVDVSTLKNTISELNSLGIKNTFAYFDAGYFSEDNIKSLQKEEINFLTRLPSIRCLYKELIESEASSLEKHENLIKYGERGLFIKQKEINLFGKKGYAHVVLDPKRKGREIDKLAINTIDEKEKNKEELEYQLLTRGIMILVSSCKIKKEDVVPAYYVRQTAEKMFGFSKDDLKLLPLGVHGEETLRGFLLMQFLSLAVFVKIKKTLGKKYTVEDLTLIMRNLKAKVYEKNIIIGELTKKQKELCEKLGIIMPKNLGV